MKWSAKKEVPWIKDYVKQYDPEVGDTFVVDKIIKTEKGGLVVITKGFKCYLFPDSADTKGLDEYLNNAHDSQINQIVVAISETYPYWELNDETDLMVEVHYPYDGKITLTPIPSVDQDALLAKKTRVNVGKKKQTSDA